MQPLRVTVSIAASEKHGLLEGQQDEICLTVDFITASKQAM